MFCYKDTCDYTSRNYFKCGDFCVKDITCNCGSERLRYNSEYCCAPASSCVRTETGVNCTQGEVHQSLAFCNATGKCFNDILTSQHFTVHATYTCQKERKCMRWGDIYRSVCQGVNLCAGDEELCRPEVRCPVLWDGLTSVGRGEIYKSNMSTIPVRSYCYNRITFDETINNGAYDLLDRSDEDLSENSVSSAQSINFTALVSCTKSDGDGVLCAGGCKHTAIWCNEKWDGYCEDSGVWRTDPRLCSHPTFWQERSCKMTSEGHLYPGLRCTGAIKHCYYPQG